MKKPILLLITILTFIISTDLRSQSDSDDDDIIPIDEMVSKERFSEFGINATTFINEFISLNSNDADLGNYMLTYKYHLGNQAIRAGFGGRYSQSDEDTDGNGNRVALDNSIHGRVGYELNKSISTKWNFYIGVDLIGGFNKTETTTNNFENVKITKEETYFGGGPVIGIQFFLNSHISLATEGSLYYRNITNFEKEEFSNNSMFNTENMSTNNVADFGLPTALFFIIRF